MVLFVVFFVLVIVVGFASYFIGQQRIRDIATFAGTHGLTVVGNEWDLGDCGFSLFHAGNRRYWHNVVRGSWQVGGSVETPAPATLTQAISPTPESPPTGIAAPAGLTQSVSPTSPALPVTYCDYSYVVSDGKNQNTISFSNVLTPLGVQIPQVTVSPRSALGAFAEKSIGAPGIRFQSIDFNDRFDVQSNDNAFAVELIDARMIELLLELDRGYHVVFGPEYLMVYAHRRPVAEIGAIFDATAAVVQRIPALVRSRLASLEPALETPAAAPPAPPGS